ncbi:MAG: ABC-F family ATP-binding cassette domain-containing protein [Fibromonadaceae bacterium]|jgi:ATP-binding cassette subfamily F protein 3|nr:ABC-F family ATP-binding cassette domain-containing protein [Fibromonadaceae bacterium]
MIQIQNLQKSFGMQMLLSDASFQVGAGERIGVVGKNGSGKSTLFKIILGEEGFDSGNINIPKNYSIGYLSQHLNFTHATVFDEACSALKPNEDGWVESYKAEAILSGLGFDKEIIEKKSPAMLSGGFQIRLNLAKSLAAEPSMLLLDEPTNYLDIVSVRWLQKFLKNWKGELMLITHDRRFMDRVCTHTLGIHRQKMRKIQGSVAKLQDAILADEEVYLKTIENDAAKREHLQKFIERFRYKSSKAKSVQSKVKALERHEPLANLEKIKTLDFEFTETDFPSKKMFTMRHLTFGYDINLPLIEDLNFELYRNDRLAIIGPNGKGKTTLLNLIAGELKANSGSVDIHNSAVINYFGQTNVNRLDLEKTVEEEIQASLEDRARGKARTLAGVMMFEGDNALKKISVLSGGERSRVLLAKILGKPCNLLLLDEPTNHLDMDSVDSLIEALDEFKGAAILVSHDEEIIHSFAKRLIIFDSGKAKFFDGTYQDFLDRVGWNAETIGVASRPPSAAAKNDRRVRAEQILQKSRATRPLEQRIKQLENEIQQKENFIAESEKSIIAAAEAGEGLKIAEISKEIENAKNQISSLYAEWENVNAKLETNQKL